MNKTKHYKKREWKFSEEVKQDSIEEGEERTFPHTQQDEEEDLGDLF